MHKALFAVFFLLFVTPLTSNEIKIHPIVRDIKDINHMDNVLPKNYRTTQDEVISNENSSAVNFSGLKDLKIAGCGQFNEFQLKEISSRLNTPIFVFDLREETHLILETLDGKQLPISAFTPLNLGNEGKTLDDLYYEHLHLRNYILEQGILTLLFGKGEAIVEEDNPPIFEVGNVFTEKEIIEKLQEEFPSKFEYIYLPITDHKIPTNKTVDIFLELIKNKANEQELTLLFHCRAGRGRTGMFMVLYDIIKNAKKHHLTLEQIIHRQELLGSPNFAQISTERSEQSLERYKFLNNFYDFAISDYGYEANTSFQEWLQPFHILPIIPE